MAIWGDGWFLFHIQFIIYRLFIDDNIMFLPADSEFRVIPTEDDAKRCSSFSRRDDENTRSFQEEGIQRYYEYFQIQRTSRSMGIIIFVLFIVFSMGLHISFTKFEGIWVIRVVLIIRLLLCIIGCYIYFKIFHARVHPHESSREEFQRYVAQVTALSNFIVITLAAVMWRMFGKHR